MLNRLILYTLVNLCWFLVNWDCFLIAFLWLLFDCLSCETLLRWLNLNWLVFSWYCFLILLIFHLGLVHYAFVCIWFNLLNTLVFEADPFGRDTHIFHAGWLRFHTFCVLDALILSKEHCPLNGSINRLVVMIVSLHRLINHLPVAWLNRHIMFFNGLRFWLLGHLNSLRSQAWTMIDRILHTLRWFIEYGCVIGVLLL